MPRSRLITWSPSVTLVPTRQCFNACDYCSFRHPPSLSPAPDGLPGDALGDVDALALLRARPRLPRCSCSAARWRRGRRAGRPGSAACSG
nr:hypothetical protein [Synechococcus sp. GFB01]